ncbi:MAG: hypothetical protein DRR19_17225 [Candidatus Parabeggiatoa sp. nov. 1]|nr:MAG: hypothetical protein DRR19_17225 [Gammaproteobacteria bacterium]
MKDDIPQSLIPLSLLLVGLATTSVAGAQESRVTVHEKEEPVIQSFDARFITGLMYYKYSDAFVDKLSDNIPFYGVGATYGISSPIGNISFDAYLQRSDKGKDGFFEENLDDNFKHPTNTDARFNRDDYAITMTYQIGSIYGWQFPIFVGYKWGKTHVERTEITLFQPNDDPLARIETNDPLARIETNFKTKGPVIGLGITFPIATNKEHRAGIYGAYGRLTSEYNTSIFLGEKYLDAGTVTQPTEAWKYGINFNGLIAKLPIGWGKLNYTISLDSYNYSMSLKPRSGDPTSSIDEQIYSVNASVNWAF